MRNKKGFTLIEVLVVMAIIAVLASLMLAAISAARTQQKNTQRRASVTAIRAGLEAFYATNRRYPQVTMDGLTLVSTNVTGLGDLFDDRQRLEIDDPNNENWRICYASQVNGRYALFMRPEPGGAGPDCPTIWDGGATGQPVAELAGWEDFSLR
jgi:type IV pilus assembly protein PilA